MNRHVGLKQKVAKLANYFVLILVLISVEI